VAAYLFKTEPADYSFADLERDQRVVWEGVANALALIHLRAVRKGDTIVIYHTGSEKRAVGLARATRGAYPDPALDDPRRVVVNLAPVRALPEGRSPAGCYQMSGNVWEWTESERDDGHTRFCILRGGSWFKAEGSGWYVPGGPQPCTSHAKFLLLWPGLDRCSTIGFRCVRDRA